jgi:uncharacterized protein HemY
MAHALRWIVGLAVLLTVLAPAARGDDALNRAAECLDRGDEAGALPHLREHVRTYPEAAMIRAHLAELLVRLGRPAEARGHFERFVADAQTMSGPTHRHLVHCHTRLMELARRDHDLYREHLHCGIGLLLLVERWKAEPDRQDPVLAEQTLVKALTALRIARNERPTDARANLYLAEVLDRLGQPGPACVARRTAHAGLPDPSLTHLEREKIEAAHDSPRP